MFSFFGIPVKLNLKKSVYKDILLNELVPYQVSDRETSVEITDDWTSFNPNLLSKNPSSHFYYKNCIHFKDLLTEVAFVFNDEQELKTIYFKLLYSNSFVKRSIRKWLHMQFSNRIENIGQIFHENILIPLTFFQDNLALIHASGIAKDGKGILLGGTGGVGKTTLELESCLKHNFDFITDDIAVIDNEGNVYPNFNYPKIYGYNLLNNTPLKKKIFKQLNFINKIHWHLHTIVFGSHKVRRRINPTVFYNSVKNEKTSLKKLFVLIKKETDTIKEEVLSSKHFSQINTNIIFTEYNYFINHIKWHEINALVNNNTPIITSDYLQQKWGTILTELKQEKATVEIPLNIDHEHFKKYIFIDIKDLNTSK